MIQLGNALNVCDGVKLWPGVIDASRQCALVSEILSRVAEAPFYTPLMPVSGKPFSVRETNFGELGWIADVKGYRYEPMHPQTKAPWPDIPEALLEIWRSSTGRDDRPQCCLVNLYQERARMGLHRDGDEEALDVPVVSVSLGDDALFRIGGLERKGPTQSVRLRSGDVLAFGGPARLAYHGIDRIFPCTSPLVPEGGRLNLTMRMVYPRK